MLFSSPSMVNNNELRRHEVSAGSLAWPDRFFPFFFGLAEPKEKRKKAVWPRETNLLVPPISVFSCYTPELLCGNGSSRCTLIAYRDGGSAKEKCKLRNIHCMYCTQVRSVFMLTTLCTLPRYFVYNNLAVRLLAVTTSTHSPLLLYTVNINLCGVVYSVLHGVLIIISGRGSSHLH